MHRRYIARLRLLDQVLADGREFLCHRFTIADISIAYARSHRHCMRTLYDRCALYCRYALFLGTTLGLDGRYQPQTRAYMERMMQRPAWTAAQRMQDDPACTMPLPSAL
jgi:glutathione S-transferase